MSNGRIKKIEQTKHKRRRIKLIDEQDRRCAACTIEMDTRDALYEIDLGPGLIVHRGCFLLYKHAKKYEGPVLNKILLLVTEGYNDGNTT